MKFRRLFLRISWLLSSSLLALNLNGIGFDEAYDPYLGPTVTLSNSEGQQILCDLKNYDFEKELVQIYLEAQKRLMWIDPSVLSAESRAIIQEWRMRKAIYDYIIIDSELASPDSNTNSNQAKYVISVRNLSKTSIDPIEIRYRIYKRAAAHFNSSGSSGSSDEEWQYVEGSQKTNPLNQETYETAFTTTGITINKSSLKTTTTITTVDGGGNTLGSRVGSVKKESSRDSLKGIIIQIRYKDVLVKTWCKDRTLEEFVDW